MRGACGGDLQVQFYLAMQKNMCTKRIREDRGPTRRMRVAMRNARSQQSPPKRMTHLFRGKTQTIAEVITGALQKRALFLEAHRVESSLLRAPILAPRGCGGTLHKTITEFSGRPGAVRIALSTEIFFGEDLSLICSSKCCQSVLRSS